MRLIAPAAVIGREPNDAIVRTIVSVVHKIGARFFRAEAGPNELTLSCKTPGCISWARASARMDLRTWEAHSRVRHSTRSVLRRLAGAVWGRKRNYRNHFVVGVGFDDYNQWQQMAAASSGSIFEMQNE
jgi:hypothetical protein